MSFKPLPDLLASYAAFDDIEAATLQQLNMFLMSTGNAYDRSNLVAHVVADAWIVNPARTHVVMVEHKLDEVWGAPGGHCDGSPDVIEAARREALEEAGLSDLTLLLDGAVYDLCSGTVPYRMKAWGAEPAHLHFDVCFAFEAPDNAPLTISDESTGLAWIPIRETARYRPRAAHQRRIDKMLKGVLG